MCATQMLRHHHVPAGAALLPQLTRVDGLQGFLAIEVQPQPSATLLQHRAALIHSHLRVVVCIWVWSWECDEVTLLRRCIRRWVSGVPCMFKGLAAVVTSLLLCVYLELWCGD